MIPAHPTPHAPARPDRPTSAGAATGPAAVRVWLATTPVDLRCSFDTLAEHVRTHLALDPLGGHLFVFRNRSAQRLKILWWDGSGLVLYYKRLERGTFAFPATDQRSVTISSAELLRLLQGWAVAAPHGPVA